MKNLTELAQWQNLAQHYQTIASHHMRQYFADDLQRFTRFSISYDEIILDYSRNRIQKETIALLCELAAAVDLPKKIDALFTGSPINSTEKRPALHTALRDQTPNPIIVNGKDIKPVIKKTRERMQALVHQIHERKWLGATGKPIKHIVNVGIGGSHLGPMMCTYALKPFTAADLKFHFIASVDKDGLIDVLQQIDPETSLFIISSKTFSTIETLTNAKSILAWMTKALGKETLNHHFIAVTTAEDKAINFGIPKEHIFPLWDWVGGRYSVWSAIGLPLMLMIGTKHFDEFLAGAFAMDQHFKSADFSKNMPVLLALLGIWYMNFFGSSAQAIVPYSHRLRYLVPYLQQAEMESNGKSISLAGNPVAYATAPIIFGEEGCSGQHAYHQLLLQGKHLVPVDFILIATATTADHDAHQDILFASGLSQAQALMHGKTYKEAYDELIERGCCETEANQLAYHRMIPGNRPSNILFLERLSPKNLGALIALYEHKIFVQGAIWNINSFDQWGVELGKQLLPHILQTLQNSAQDSSVSAGLIQHFKKIREDA